MRKRPDDLDDDHTDELPVLLETVAVAEVEEPLVATQPIDDTAAHALRGGAAARLAELAADRAEEIPALEAQIRTLTDATRDLEGRLADKDRLIAELKDTLGIQRRSNEDAVAAQSRTATQLATRDELVAELMATVEQLNAEAAARSAELVRLHDEAEGAGGRTGALNSERVAALEHELAEGARRSAAADELAARESRRAVALRAQLVEYARRAEALERELRLARSSSPATPPPSAVGEPETPPAIVTPMKPAGWDDAAPAAALSDAPVLTDAVDPSLTGFEAVARLEAELEFKRQQVAAQLVELREREQRLRAVTGELESALRELAALRTELEENRSRLARLERAVVEKDRALEARAARVAALHDDLRQHLGATEKRSPLDSKGAPTAAPPSGGQDGAMDGATSPALVCLTGDAPTRFVITKSSITVGRGPQCDLQILTHFVSREHARVTLNGGVAFIEDLGSRNGVFVNSVRVDRRPLRQGDLVTIGETQFRFVESMAH